METVESSQKIKWRRFTPGQWIISMYFVIFYFFPIIGNFLFADNIYSIYKLPEGNWLAIFAILFVFIFFILLSKLLDFRKITFSFPGLEYFKNCSMSIGKRYIKYRSQLSAVAFLAAAYFFIKGFFTYRYGYQSLSERGSYFLIFGILVSNVVFLDLLYQMFIKKQHQIVQFSKAWWTNVGFGMSCILFSGGTSSSFLALLSCFYAFFPETFQKLWFIRDGISNFKRAIQYGKLIPTCLLLFVLALLQGESIKYKAGREAENFEATKILYDKRATGVTPVNLELVPIYHFLRNEFLAEVSSKNHAILGGLVKYNTFYAGVQQEKVLGVVARIKRTLIRIFTEGKIFGDRSGKKKQYIDFPVKKGGPNFMDRARSQLDEKLASFTDSIAAMFSKQFLYYITERFSSHYYSYSFLVKNSFENLHWQGVPASLIPFGTFLFRADFISGRFLGISRPTVNSVAQLNYKLLAESPNKTREGTSPGLIGSFSYAFPWPVGTVVTIFYLFFICFLLDGLLNRRKNERISLLGLVILLHVFQNFMDSPLDFLILIDNSIFKVMIIVGMFLYVQSKDNSETLQVIEKSPSHQ